MKMLFAAAILGGSMLASAVAAESTNRIDLIRPDAPELATPGDLPVGVRTLTVTNPNQIDILKVEEGKDLPRYDRPLTLEVWYPAAAGTGTGGTYSDVQLRDGVTKVELNGLAVRGADPLRSAQPFPLVVISHGIRATGFCSAIWARTWPPRVCRRFHRPHGKHLRQQSCLRQHAGQPALDQRFVINEIDRMSKAADSSSTASSMPTIPA